MATATNHQDLSEDLVSRTFEHLRQTGHLRVILGVLAQHQGQLQARAENALENLEASSLKDIREYGKLQGRLAETKRLLRVFDAWSKKDTRRRNDDGEIPREG